MPRSADSIDAKVLEADFFLEKLANTGSDFFAARCYFSAFVSAARSITFAMQAVLSDVEGFPAWYATKQQYLRGIPAARFFLETRNETQKIGLTPLNLGTSRWRPDGPPETTYYFRSGFEGDPAIVPDTDVVTACREHLKRMIEIVYDCYETFDVMSPLSFFSVPNLVAREFTLEDMEEALGFPRGWTDLLGATVEDRHRVLRREHPDTAIDRLFLRYLGHARKDREAAG
jgi:hypothetical protein